MPANARKITRDDIMDMADYGLIRKQKRAELRPLKTLRRIAVGPFATFYFETYETMWHQVHEMLYAEKGGDAQLADELAAFNPLIPQGRELVATLMFEITDEVQRGLILRQLTHVEGHIFIRLGGEKIPASADDDVERTAEDGKTSSVHFVRFTFTPAQIKAFKTGADPVLLGFDHPNYGHMAALSPESRAVLVEDFE